MAERMSDAQVGLTVAGLLAFVFVLWTQGMVTSPEAGIGFFVIGYALLYLGGQILSFIRR